MKLIHNVTVTVFSHVEDIRVLPAFKALVPVDFEKIDVRQKNAEGHEQKIVIHTMKLHKGSHIRALLDNLSLELSVDDKEAIFAQRESRIDEEGFFYIRLDKDLLLDLNKYVLTESGNCVHFKIKMAAYPVTKEKALAAMEAMWEKYF